MFAQKYRKQFYGTLCANIICVAYGTVAGWPSASFPELLSDNASPLPSGALSMDQLSWVGSFMCIGAIFGNSFFSWSSDRFGRKNALIQSALPCLFGWCLLIFAQNVYYLYVARFLLGFSGAGAFVVIPLFVSEIAEKEVRGSLGSLMVFSNNVGILISFIAGHYLDYWMRPVVLLVFPIVFLALFVSFPETPTFLAKHARQDEANLALRYYRNVGANESDAGAALESELEELNKRNQCDEKTATTEVCESIAWSEFSTRHGRRSSLIGVMLIFGSQFCGCFAMLNYTADIFAQSGSTMSSNVAAILMGVVQLLGAYVSTVLVDRAGRKFLLAASSVGSALGLIAMATFMRFQTVYDLQAYAWIPMVGFGVLVFAANWGLMTLPFLVISELMPDQVRSIGTSFCMTLLYVLGFVLLKGFPLLVQLLDMSGALYVFAACSLTVAAFVIGWLPETCGKSFEAIQRMMEK